MQTVRELWNNMFDASLETYKHEDESIVKLSMILHVLKEEHQRIYEYILELKSENNLLTKEIFEYKKTPVLCACKANNRTPLKTLNTNNNETTPAKETYVNQNISIPFNLSDDGDLFNHQITDQDLSISKENDNSLFIDDSLNDLNITTSPTLNKHKKKRKSRLKDKADTSMKDTLIMNTPTPIINRSRKLKQSKLCISSLNNTASSKNEPISKYKTPIACTSVDSDETLFISGIQRYNVDKPIHTDSEVLGILENLKEGARPINKKFKRNDSYDYIPDREEQSPDFAYKREAVRKKSERLKLQGWDCQDCEKYYATYKNKLSDEEIKNRMDNCSRHRDKFNPNILTPKGFWNPEFSPTQDSMAFDI